MTPQQDVACSVVQAIQTSNEEEVRPLSLGRRVGLFFVLRRLKLIRHQACLFQGLRRRWCVAESDYSDSFADASDLQSAGDMGYSGSTFFTTANGSYIVKSVPRRFEYSFFREDLLPSYATHVRANLNSLLIRITDFLVTESPSIGGSLGLVPTHHIVMENLLYGRDQARQTGDDSDWETWDLKPDSYFFPERDIAGGRLTSQATKSKLADKFDDEILLSKLQAAEFLAHLEADTKLLEDSNAVDYSLFLIRTPVSPSENPFADPPGSSSSSTNLAWHPPEDSPLVPPTPPTWRSGIESQDGKYIFRAAILDFFWAKHKTHAQCMTLLVNAWNVFDRKGPMSITTTPQEYRERFLRMCRNIIETRD